MLCKVVTVKSVTLAYATFRLATRVVLVTVNGAVPTATLEISLGDVIVEDAVIVPVPTVPLSTVKVFEVLSKVKPATPFKTF